MRAFIELTKNEFRLFFREFMAFFFTLIFPVLMLFVFGGIYGNEPDPNPTSQYTILQNHGYVDTFVPALMYLVLLVTGIMSLPIGIATYRETKILKRFKASTISPYLILLSNALVLIIISIIGCIALLICGKIVYNLQIEGSFFPIVASIFLAMLMTFSVGFMISSLAKTSRGASALANLLYYPMMFLSGSMIPLFIFSKTMQDIVEFVPAKHAVKLIQDVWLGEAAFFDDYKEILILLGVSIVCSLISVKTFKWE